MAAIAVSKNDYWVVTLKRHWIHEANKREGKKGGVDGGRGEKEKVERGLCCWAGSQSRLPLS